MSDQDDDTIWKHRIMKMMMAVTFGMMFMCAALVVHLIKG